jgi:hypothetical protein
MKDSMLPFLFIAQIALLWSAVRRARRAGKISDSQSASLYTVVGLLALWTPISGFLAISGIYTSPAVLGNLPGLWVTMVPVVVLMVPWLASASFRDSINQVIDAVGLHNVVLFEGLRVLAIGGIVKGLRGEFSAELAFYLGIPDLIFGALSLWAAYQLYKGSLSLKWVLALNAYGFLIIVPGGVVLMNLGIPGPWHIIHTTPDMVSMFQYPMALAPTAVVPIFVAINAFIVNYVLTHNKTQVASTAS